VVSDDEISERMMYPMINEARASSKRASRASERHRRDLALWLWLADLSRRPMFYADQVGLKHIADRLSYYAKGDQRSSLERRRCSSVSPRRQDFASLAQRKRLDGDEHSLSIPSPLREGWEEVASSGLPVKTPPQPPARGRGPAFVLTSAALKFE